MDLVPHYAFALGYQNGLKGNDTCPVKLCPELQGFYDAGYEQGSADDVFGEINESLLIG